MIYKKKLFRNVKNMLIFKDDKILVSGTPYDFGYMHGRKNT